MKRIAIYIDTQYKSGGKYQYTKSLINAIYSISSNNFALTFLYTKRSWEDYLKSYSGVDCIFLRKSQILNITYQVLISLGFFKLIKFLSNKLDGEIRFIDNLNFDFVMFPASDTIACLVNSKSIGTIHDLMHRYERRFKESGGFFKYRFRENYFKRILYSSKAILVDSELGERHVRESYKKIKARIFILPYIAPDYVYSQNIDKEKPINGPETTSNFIFYPSQFWPHKNHYNLLKALKILKDRGNIIDLILSGGMDREYWKLLKFVENNSLHNQVKFMGYIPESELVLIYRKALAMVMPTFFGPTNIPPIEAILLGCPPIVSNIYGMPYQFENAALYFNPDDPIEIADRIEQVLKDKKLRMRILENGEIIKMKFSQERFRNDIEDILRRIFDN